MQTVSNSSRFEETDWDSVKLEVILNKWITYDLWHLSFFHDYNVQWKRNRYGFANSLEHEGANKWRGLGSRGNKSCSTLSKYSKAWFPVDVGDLASCVSPYESEVCPSKGRGLRGRETFMRGRRCQRGVSHVPISVGSFRAVLGSNLPWIDLRLL